MTYLQRSNYGKSRKRIVPLLIILVFSLFAFGVQSSRGKIFRGPFYYIALPVWKVEDVFLGWMENFFISFNSKKSLLEENRLLKEKLQATELASFTVESFKSENEELKKMLGFVESEDFKVSVASVVSAPPESPYDTLIIDLGKNQGVEVGMSAWYDNVKLGEVEEVGSRTSKVRLLSSPEVSTQISFKSGVKVSAVGKGGGNFEVEIPKGVKIGLQEIAYLAGSPDSIVAVVGSVTSNASDPFDTVLLKSPINIYTVSILEIKHDNQTE